MPNVDRRILKSQEAIKTAVTELMAEKRFDSITIQDIADRANVNRGTVYLHYSDKFNLLDKLMEEHIDTLRNVCETQGDMEWKPATAVFFEYFERNYLFFSTMLASQGSHSFRARFLEFLIEEFKLEVDTTVGKNRGFKQDIVVHFIGTAYVGVLEWWLSNGMPYSPQVIAEQLGGLLERNIEG